MRKTRLNDDEVYAAMRGLVGGRKCVSLHCEHFARRQHESEFSRRLCLCHLEDSGIERRFPSDTNCDGSPITQPGKEVAT